MTRLHAPWLIGLAGILAVVVLALSMVFSPNAETSPPATPTATKTPTVSLFGDAASGFSAAAALLPTATPTPTATPLSTPTPEIADVADTLKPAAWVVTIAQAHDINPDGPYVVVDQNNQQMHIVRDGKVERILHITTGDPRYGWDTPAWSGVIGPYWGTFQGRGGVTADDGWWLFNLNGGDYLVHSLPYRLSDAGDKVYEGEGSLGAAPASHGCIRLSPEDAAWFSSKNPQGMPIVILPYTGLRGAAGMIAIPLLLLAVVLLLAGVGLYVRAERQRRSAGLPAGEVITADVGAWRRSERPLLSRRYGLVGRPDYLVDTADGLVPVEVKSTRLAGPDPYLAHKLQLAAYCLLVEDTTGSRPPYGIVHYANTTVRLAFTDDLRTTLLQTLAAMRQARPARQVRRSHDDPARCRRCGFHYACGSEALD